MIEIHIQKASNSDAKDIASLVNSVYRGESAKKGWTNESDLIGGQRIDARGIEALISKPHSYIFVMYQGNALLGSVHLEKTQGHCYLGMLSIDASKQGAGLGKRLMTYSENFARETLKCAKMQMTVIGQRLELIDYYKRRGYALTGEKKPFPADDPRHGILKRKDLYFEVMEKSL
jgi:ribosomal protein S18 acetylase RimI-like enzyme